MPAIRPIPIYRGPDNTGDQVTLLYRRRHYGTRQETLQTTRFLNATDAREWHELRYPEYNWERVFYTHTGWDDSPRWTNPSPDARRKLQRKIYYLRRKAREELNAT
jgi:hypothetical protein